jgi:predicted aminopeptidase
VNYRGYFDEDRRSRSPQFTACDDVHIGGVPAFSTLGY